MDVFAAVDQREAASYLDGNLPTTVATGILSLSLCKWQDLLPGPIEPQLVSLFIPIAVTSIGQSGLGCSIRPHRGARKIPKCPFWSCMLSTTQF